MKIAALSDLHGYLPEPPECDILLLAGDLCPATYPNRRNNWFETEMIRQRSWLVNCLAPWIKSTGAACFLTWGNHDWVGENADYWPDLPAYILVDERVNYKGLNIYGSPWQLRFFDWAFNLDEPALSEKFDLIQPCDILITHSPPFGIGDWAPSTTGGKSGNVGSQRLLEKTRELKPKLHVFGHIHAGYGTYPAAGLIKDQWTYSMIYANCSHMNENYEPVNRPKVFNDLV